MPSRQSNHYNKLHSGKNLAEVPLKMKQEYEKNSFEILVNIDQKVPEIEDMEKFVENVRKILAQGDTTTILHIFQSNPRFFNRVINVNHKDVLEQVQNVLTQNIEQGLKKTAGLKYASVMVTILWIYDEMKKKPQDNEKIEKLKLELVKDVAERKKYESDNEERNVVVEKELTYLGLVEQTELV